MKPQKYEKVLTSIEQLSESNKDYVLGLLDRMKFNRLQEKNESGSHSKLV